ncbi:hypothetical protein C0J52_23305 [Blattella germanica]|nr:hypothetical protein C0J52_23305 [Blattella germanica]
MVSDIQPEVAVKIIDTSKIKEDYVARNLEREALVLSRLSHPSIVYLYETLKCGTVFYMVTELAPGGDLCTFIKRQKNGHLDERVARRFGRQLVSAIVHMHNRGVVHRFPPNSQDHPRERSHFLGSSLPTFWLHYEYTMLFVPRRRGSESIFQKKKKKKKKKKKEALGGSILHSKKLGGRFEKSRFN